VISVNLRANESARHPTSIYFSLIFNAFVDYWHRHSADDQINAKKIKMTKDAIGYFIGRSSNFLDCRGFIAAKDQ
jgi:hypothetical protein